MLTSPTQPIAAASLLWNASFLACNADRAFEGVCVLFAALRVDALLGVAPNAVWNTDDDLVDEELDDDSLGATELEDTVASRAVRRLARVEGVI
jgi:hypothetical protein